MGRVSAVHLAKLGYEVYAGCYNLKGSEDSLREELKAVLMEANVSMDEKGIEELCDKLKPVQLDVTKEDSIQAAFDTVQADLKKKGVSLTSIINCAGVGYNGPIEYMPIKMYREQMEVNYFGYVMVTQKFLPLVKQAVQNPEARRGRVIFVGTGGGVMSPAPALLSAYMGSKWAGEAYIQVLRIEMAMQKLRIDASMVNPGFIKPTALVDGGKRLIDRLWKESLPQAKEEYEWLVDKFVQFSDAEVGTHPRFIAAAMEEIMAAERPNNSYKVGPDSQAAPFAGLLPWKLREFVIRGAMYGEFTWNVA
jgi:NAD(P)-dependent dehydrogenase (short-subunit alcohol dehydrogenase family)